MYISAVCSFVLWFCISLYDYTPNLFSSSDDGRICCFQLETIMKSCCGFFLYLFFVVIGQMHSFLFHLYLKVECLGDRVRVRICLALVDAFGGVYNNSLRFSFRIFLLAAGTAASCQPSLGIASAEEYLLFSSHLWTLGVSLKT